MDLEYGGVDVKAFRQRVAQWLKMKSGRPPLRCAVLGHAYVDYRSYAQCERVSLLRRRPCRRRLLKRVRFESVSLIPDASTTPFTLSLGFGPNNNEKARL